MAPPRKIQVTPGQRFGRLIVLEETRYNEGTRTTRGLRVACDCGSVVELRLHVVVRGDAESCGCIRPQVKSGSPRNKIEWSEDLWKEVERGCWEWQGTLGYYGYGQFGGSKKAHREAMERHLGRELDSSEHVLHACDNPPCVRPDHLFLGDQALNMADMFAKGRNKIARKKG